MNRERIVRILRADVAEIRAAGVVALYLYGSASADRLNEDSDVDLFADVDYCRFGFLPCMKLRERFMHLLGKPVDFTTRNALHPDLKQSVERSAVKVFDESSGFVVAE